HSWELYLHKNGREVNVQGREVHVQGRKVNVQGRKVHVQGQEVHVQGREVHVQGREVHVQGREVHVQGRKLVMPNKVVAECVGKHTRPFRDCVYSLTAGGSPHDKARPSTLHTCWMTVGFKLPALEMAVLLHCESPVRIASGDCS
uniref:Uncharacterized protein n=1 Tax=Paramormyrops kingsleyae TaxID=1676925 RepID=A0A3B3SUX5_9TELE